MAWGGYSVQPAPVGPPGKKKLATSTSPAKQVYPVAHHVQVGENLSGGPTISGMR